MTTDVQLRVGHVVPGYLPSRGGVETLLEGVIPVLRDSYGIESTVIAPRSLSERPLRFRHNGHEVFSVDVPNRYSLESVEVRGARLMASCRRALEELHLDILHVHGIWPLSTPMTWVARARGIPVLHHVHGELLSDTRESQRRVLRDSTWVIAVSQQVASSIEAVANRPGPIEVVVNGIADVSSQVTDTDPRRLALIGRLQEQKGFHHGLEALAEVLRRIPDSSASIVGVGEELINLQGLASRLGVARQVTFHGRIDHQSTLDVMARCSVVVVPSVSTEGFSLVAAEAALLGKPVVAYRVGGLAETVEDGRSGTLVEVGHVKQLAGAVCAYMSDPELRQSHGAIARPRALKRFGLDRFASDLAQRYATIANVDERRVI